MTNSSFPFSLHSAFRFSTLFDQYEGISVRQIRPRAARSALRATFIRDKSVFVRSSFSYCLLVRCMLNSFRVYVRRSVLTLYCVKCYVLAAKEHFDNAAMMQI